LGKRKLIVWDLKTKWLSITGGHTKAESPKEKEKTITKGVEKEGKKKGERRQLIGGGRGNLVVLRREGKKGSSPLYLRFSRKKKIQRERKKRRD